MKSPQEFMGMGTFIRRTGLSAPTVRLLEAKGILTPLRADSGWRMFTEADVATAIAHRPQRRKARR